MIIFLIKVFLHSIHPDPPFMSTSDIGQESVSYSTDMNLNKKVSFVQGKKVKDPGVLVKTTDPDTEPFLWISANKHNNSVLNLDGSIFG